MFGRVIEEVLRIRKQGSTYFLGRDFNRNRGLVAMRHQVGASFAPKVQWHRLGVVDLGSRLHYVEP